MTKVRSCVTHHHACDCREEKFRLIEKELELQKSWVKHHQKSVENKFSENDELKKQLTEANNIIKINSLGRISIDYLEKYKL